MVTSDQSIHVMAMTAISAIFQPVISRPQLVDLLNEDLARGYQSIIAGIVYSQSIPGAEYSGIVWELQLQATLELQHACRLAREIDYLGGIPSVTPLPVQTSHHPLEMLRLNHESRQQRKTHYRTRLRQAYALGEFTLCEALCSLIEFAPEQELRFRIALESSNPLASSSRPIAVDVTGSRHFAAPLLNLLPENFPKTYTPDSDPALQGATEPAGWGFAPWS